MLLVIFGAGASYDSVLHRPPPPVNWITAPSPARVRKFGLHEEHRPPLANQLFDDRPLFVEAMDHYPACKPLVNLLRGEVQVERRLAEFEEHTKTFPVRHQQLVAVRYYLQRMLYNCQGVWANEHRGITNYLTFLDAVYRWRYERSEQLCFVTFNYDTMLEESMMQLLNCSFMGLSAYISSPHFKLIKLHGSIDWGAELNTFPGRGTAAEIIAAAGESLDLSGSYGKLTRDQSEKADIPALAIPVEKKSEFVCPEEHIGVLAAVIPQVTKIVTIGWRATEQNFLTMLKKPLTGLQGDIDLMVVSGSEEGAHQTVNNLAIHHLGERKREFRGYGFSGLIKEIGHLESFLY